MSEKNLNCAEIKDEVLDTVAGGQGNNPANDPFAYMFPTKDYPCPQCGGTIAIVNPIGGATQYMTCLHCGKSVTIAM